MIACAPSRLPLARLAATALALLVAVSSALALTADAAGAAIVDDEARLYELTNASRAQAGLPALAYDSAAVGVARGWAQELARSGSLRHNPNLAAQVSTYVTSSWTRIGENVGYASTADQVHTAYMNSSAHRANILGAYNRVGVGAARDSAGRLWTTVVFIQGPALTAAPAPVTVGPGGFLDTINHPHALNIAKIVTAGIAGGYADGTFRPDAPVTRAQMAAFLQRGYRLPLGSGPTFPDVVGTVHEAAVRAVAGAGITTGDAAGNFRPNEWVNRGQMAAFLARAERMTLGGGAGFCDTAGHAFEREIRAVAAAGIATGGSDGCYRPFAAVTRGQLATFLVRALGL